MGGNSNIGEWHGRMVRCINRVVRCSRRVIPWRHVHELRPAAPASAHREFAGPATSRFWLQLSRRLRCWPAGQVQECFPGPRYVHWAPGSQTPAAPDPLPPGVVPVPLAGAGSHGSIAVQATRPSPANPKSQAQRAAEFSRSSEHVALGWQTDSTAGEHGRAGTPEDNDRAQCRIAGTNLEISTWKAWACRRAQRTARACRR